MNNSNCKKCNYNTKSKSSKNNRTNKENNTSITTNYEEFNNKKIEIIKAIRRRIIFC